MKAAIHEMRNHLAVAMAVAEAFLDKKLEPTDARLGGLIQSLREVDSIIGELPNEATVAFATHFMPIDVCRLIHTELIALEAYAIERGVRLDIDACSSAHPDCVQFLADPTRVGEIVTNVLTNAIRYSPEGGSVGVECRRDGAGLSFRVSDDGPGVDADERANIFEVGFRGRAAVGLPGNGIGLSLVRKFVEGQGGSIELSDGPRRGANFTIKLPGRSDVTCQTCGHHAGVSAAQR